MAQELRDLAYHWGWTDDDIYLDFDNLTVAQNGMGTHSTEGLQEVLRRLRRRRSADGFAEELRAIGRDMRNGDFYIEIGTLDP